MDNPSVPPAAAGSARARLFVSYSRRDRAFAERLAEALGGAGLEVWVDLKDIRPSEEWLAAIHAAIEGADAVVFVVSPDSVDPASVCAQEIEHASRHNKRFVPVVCRSVDTRAQAVPDAVARLNWISFLDPQAFEQGLDQLTAAIETDLEWVRLHTRLLERAVEWDRSGRDDSFVLQRNDLAAAEQWLARGPSKEPAPTTLQTAYVLESRTVATRRQRRLLLAGAVAAVLVGIGATVAAYQYLQAEDRRSEVQARALATEAQFERGRRLDRAIPLALHALSTRVLAESVDAAIAVGQTAFDVVHILHGHTAKVVAACFLPGGRQLVSLARDGRVILWDVDAGSPRQLLVSAPEGEALAIACSPSTPDVAVARAQSRLTIWHIDAGAARAAPALHEADAFAGLRFSGDGAWLATTDGATVTLRPSAGGAAASRVAQTDDGIVAMAVSRDGGAIAVGTAGGRDRPGRVLLWDRDGTARTLAEAEYAMSVGSVGLTPDGSRVAAIGIEGGLEAWQASDGTKAKLAIASGFELSDIQASAFDASGQRLIAADGRAGVVVGPTQMPNSFERVQRLAAHARPVSAVALDDSGRRAVTGDEDGTLIVHALRGDDEPVGGQLLAFDAEMAADDAAFSADGLAVLARRTAPAPPGWLVRPSPFVAAASAASAAAAAAPRFRVTLDGEHALLKDTQAAAARGDLVAEPGQPALAGAAAADGRRWAAASENLLRIATPGEREPTLGALPAGFGLISALAVRDDGGLIAVAGGDAEHALAKRFRMSDRSILLVDAATGRPVGLPLRGMRAGEMAKLEFSRDGQRLLSVGAETIVWIVGPRLWLQRACAVLEVGIDAAEWERRLPGVRYPAACEAAATARR